MVIGPEGEFTVMFCSVQEGGTRASEAQSQ